MTLSVPGPPLARVRRAGKWNLAAFSQVPADTARFGNRRRRVAFTPERATPPSRRCPSAAARNASWHTRLRQRFDRYVVQSRKANCANADNEVQIEFLRDATGQLVDVGTVKLELDMNMPGMVMHSGSTITSTENNGPDTIAPQIKPDMAGDWTATLSYQKRPPANGARSVLPRTSSHRPGGVASGHDDENQPQPPDFGPLKCKTGNACIPPPDHSCYIKRSFSGRYIVCPG